MLGFGELLLFHQDRHELSQGGDLLVLHADDGQKLEDRQEEEDRDADQGEGIVLDAQNMTGDPADTARPEGQADEGETEQQEQQGVAFLQPIRAQPSKGQQKEQNTEGQQKQVLEEIQPAVVRRP